MIIQGQNPCILWTSRRLLDENAFDRVRLHRTAL